MYTVLVSKILLPYILDDLPLYRASAEILYYGVILLATELFENDEHCVECKIVLCFDCGFCVGLTEDDNDTYCDQLIESDYVDIIWTSTAEVAGRNSKSTSHT